MKLKISRDEAGYSEAGGHFIFQNPRPITIVPGGRVFISIEFSDGLVVTKEGQSVSFAIYGGEQGALEVGISPHVESKGTLSLVWGNGGIRGNAANAAKGVVNGLWINLTSQFTPQVGHKLNAINISFEIPKAIQSQPITKQQTVTLNGIMWKNISTPRPRKIATKILQVLVSWQAVTAILSVITLYLSFFYK